MEKHLSSTWKPRLNISRLKIDRTRAMKFTLNFSVTLLLWACSMDVDDNLQSASTRWWRATSSRYLKTYETIKVPEWIQSNCSEFLRFWVWISYQLSYRGRVDEKRPRIGLHNNYAFYFSRKAFGNRKNFSEDESEHFAIGSSIASDWSRRWREFPEPIKKRTKAKQSNARLCSSLD